MQTNSHKSSNSQELIDQIKVQFKAHCDGKMTSELQLTCGPVPQVSVLSSRAQSALSVLLLLFYWRVASGILKEM